MPRIFPAALLVLILGPTKAFAVTAEEIVRLSRAGVSEQVILALIERDRTVFTIAPDQLVSLKDQGVSETVLLAMLKSAGSEETASAASGAEPLPEPGPVVGVVGHGPDRPNSAHGEYSEEIGAPDAAAPVALYPVPYLIPYPVLVAATNAHDHGHREHAERSDQMDHRVPCQATVTPSPVTPAPVTPPTFRGFGDTGPTSVRGMFFSNPATGVAPRAQSCR